MKYLTRWVKMVLYGSSSNLSIILVTIQPHTKIIPLSFLLLLIRIGQNRFQFNKINEISNWNWESSK